MSWSLYHDCIICYHLRVMKRETGRFLSFVIVAAVYLLVALCLYYVYNALEGKPLFRLFAADVAATVLVFIFSCVFGNASVYDPYWSVLPIMILAPLTLASPSPTKTILFLAVAFWGIRLTSNWAYTFHGLGHQDWRYSQLKTKTGKLYPFVNFAGIHMFPTIVVYLCLIPAITVMLEVPQYRPFCLLGILISFCAVLLQLVSDFQMQKYRKEKASPFMEEGLWKYSMHPNYLGEILMWWGVAIYAVMLLGFRWYLIIGAVVNNLMFLFISIPMADRRQAEKPGYDEYRSGKNHLIPIKLKK